MVPSTLSGEAQSLACGLGMLEWAMLHISEALDGPVTLRGYEEALRCRAPTAVVDCKSLHDHATAPTSPGGTDDKRCAIDVLIIRESQGRLKCTLRWTPGDRMLADALTKNSADPADLLRSCIRRTCYQISDETSLLQHRAQEKDRRQRLGVTRAARSHVSHGSIQGDQGNEGTGVCSTKELLFLGKTQGEDVHEIYDNEPSYVIWSISRLSANAGPGQKAWLEYIEERVTADEKVVKEDEKIL